MKLLLVRKVFNEHSTEGELFIDGKFFCYTIEDKVRAAPGEWKRSCKVYAETAIPYGTYPVMVTWSNRFKRQLTGIFNVPDFEGIRFHNGTTDKSSAGCIIMSNTKTEHGLVNDRVPMNELCNRVELVQKTDKIFITILDKMP